MQPGKAGLPLTGQASNHGAQANRLESYARPCRLAAHWLASEPGPSEKLSRTKIADSLHFFAASGETPPFGRSMTYHFAASAPFALAEHCGVSAIPPGQARRLCSKNLDFFLQSPVQQKQDAWKITAPEFPQLS